MKQLWERLAGRVDAMNLRERGLLFAVLVVVVVAFANGMVYRPMLDQQKRIEKQMEDDNKATRIIQAEIQKMAVTLPLDPDALSRSKLAQLKSDADAAEQTVRSLQKGLVSPGQIAPMLEEILLRQGKLRLIELKKLQVESLSVAKPSEASNASKAASAAASVPPVSAPANPPPARFAESIYKHGVQIVVQGQYFDLLEYLSRLEKLPNEVFWGNAQFKVDAYPNATLTLDIFTLSLERKWMSM